MIKQIICQFEDVKDFQKCIINGTEYVKVPEPRLPYIIEVLVSKKGEYGRYNTVESKKFSPNAYYIATKQYKEISPETECIIYPNESIYRR